MTDCSKPQDQEAVRRRLLKLVLKRHQAEHKTVLLNPEGTVFSALTSRPLLPSAECLNRVERPTAILVLQGSKTVSCAACTVQAKAGQCMCIGVNLPSAVKILPNKEQEPYAAAGFYLDEKLLAKLAAKMPLEKAVHGPALLSFDAEAKLLQACEQLLELSPGLTEYALRYTPLYQDLHALLLLSAAGPLLAAQHQLHGARSRAVLAMNKMQENLNYRWTLTELCRISQMSAATLLRTFKHLTGESPLHYLKMLRLLEGRRLISAGSSVSEAAFSVGYESVPQFSREFKRQFSSSPSAFSLKHRAKEAEA